MTFLSCLLYELSSYPCKMFSVFTEWFSKAHNSKKNKANFLRGLKAIRTISMPNISFLPSVVTSMKLTFFIMKKVYFSSYIQTKEHFLILSLPSTPQQKKSTLDINLALRFWAWKVIIFWSPRLLKVTLPWEVSCNLNHSRSQLAPHFDSCQGFLKLECVGDVNKCIVISSLSP